MPETLTPAPILQYGQISKFTKDIVKLNSGSLFKWGESGFVPLELWSQNTKIPSYYDASSSNIAKTNWASGHTYFPVAFKGIDWQASNTDKLIPAYSAGSIYSHNNELPVLSDAAIRIVPQDNNPIELPFLPKVGTAFKITTFQYSDLGRVEVKQNYRVLSSFDDGDDYQAVVSINDECWVSEEIDTVSGGPLYTITLSQAANINASPVFERDTIFRTYVSGTPNEDGEWKFSNSTTILVYNANANMVGFWGRIKYKKNSIGTITPKVGWGEPASATLGFSDGTENQYFATPSFPTHSISVYVNGVLWNSVSEITSAGNYVGVDEDVGIIWFGNGTAGNIPTTGAQITCEFTVVPLVAFEPAFSDLKVTADGVGINDQSVFSESKGFVIASPQTPERRIENLAETLTPASISLSIEAGTDVNTNLLCTVRALDSLSRPIKNALIKLNVGKLGTNGTNASLLSTGKFSEPVVLTNEEGYGYTYFIPSKNIWDYTVPVNLFGIGEGETGNGNRGTALSADYVVAGTAFRINSSSPAFQDVNILFDGTDSTKLRYFTVEDDDEWAPFNYESRTGGRKKRPYITSLQQVTQVTAIVKGSSVVVFIPGCQSTFPTSTCVQVQFAPVKTIIWASLAENPSLTSSTVTRLFNIIEQSGIDGQLEANSTRILQAGWTDPAGTSW